MEFYKKNSTKSELTEDFVTQWPFLFFANILDLDQINSLKNFTFLSNFKVRYLIHYLKKR